MLLRNTGLTIRDLSTFLNKQPQTVRLHLKNSGIMPQLRKAGKEYILTEETARKFVAKIYPVHYNEFVNRFSLSDGEKGATMFPIPKGKGVISSRLHKSGNRYYYIRNLPLYTDENGKVITYNSKGFTSKEVAESERSQMIADRDNGIYKLRYIHELGESQMNQSNNNPAANETYYNFCKQLFDEADHATATRELYTSIIENRIKPFFGDTPIQNLTKGLLQTFVNQYTTDIRKMFTVLRQSLRKLYSLDLIPEMYYTGLIKPKSTAPRHPKEALTQDEVSRFLAYFKGHPKEYAILLLFKTGLRIGELQALYWSEVEFINDERGLIHVNASWGKTEQGLARKKPKTESSQRVIPFTDAYLVKLLKQAKAGSKTDWVLENASHCGPIEKKNFTNRYFKEVGKKLGITKPMSSHVARHTYISHLVKKNIPLTTVAKLAGHDTIEMIVKVYAHAIDDVSQEFDYVNNLYN